MAGLDPGADGELLARALALEPPALRASVVAALKGAAGEGRLEALRAALGRPGSLDGAALVAVMLTRPGAEDGPLERVLAALPGPVRLAALAGALPPGSLEGAGRETVARAAHLAGIAVGDVRGFDQAFHLAGSADKAVASKALELIEAALPDPALRRELLRALRG